MNFIISPRDNLCAQIDWDTEIVTVVSPSGEVGEQFSTATYASRFPDSSIVGLSDVNAALAELSEQQNKCYSLDFALILFDTQLDIDLRKEAAQELAKLLKDIGNREYVLDVMLASPLSDSADVDGALEAAGELDEVADLVKVVVESQINVQRVNKAWMSVRSDPLVRAFGHEAVLGNLIRFGIFRNLVIQGRTKGDRGRLQSDNLFTRFNDQCSSKIVSKLIDEFTSELPSIAATQPNTFYANLQSPSVDDFEEKKPDPSKVRQKRVNAETELSKIERTISRIVELFGNNNDREGERVLKELIELQSRDRQNPSLIVKSLCNLATKARDVSRTDISLRCLTTAQQYPEGIDSILYLQMGKALRDIQHYENAISCFEKAKQLDDGTKVDNIRWEIIQTAADSGDYEKAILMYSEFPNLARDSKYYCKTGVLFRRLGRLSAARRCYEHAIAISRDESLDHYPKAGLAEANKQSGHPHKAIAKYHRIFEQFPKLDQNAKRVYKLALAFLYRRTKQPDRARTVLDELLNVDNMDAGAHLQYAKLYLALGMKSKAEHHLQQCVPTSFDDLGAQLFAAAFKDTKIVPKSSSMTQQMNTVVLPEDVGLSVCLSTMKLMEEGEFTQAKVAIEGATYVDKMERQVGNILAFHIAKRINPAINCHYNSVIGNIAKHGLSDFKQAVQLIDRGEFQQARDIEDRLCLLTW